MLKKIKMLVLLVFPLILSCVCSYGADKFFEGGASLRSRHEYWKNVFDLENTTKDNRNYFRFKGSVWSRLNFTKNAYVYSKLTDEFKTYIDAPSNVNTQFNADEVVFDNLYFDAKNIFNTPIDLRIGRQDFLFTYGEGFLIMDGTPLDGSRTFYFNAAKVLWNINKQNSLDFVYINNPKNDRHLFILNERTPKQSLSFSDEEAFVAYFKSNSLKNTYLETYYIYKHEDGQGAGLQAQEGEINTWGSFVKYNYLPFTVRGQLAYQHGDYGSQKRSGLGGYLFLDTSFKEKMWEPKVSIGGIYLSGDDPSTGKNEGWNPLFSRWPWMSELYILSYAGESGLGYWTNLIMWRAEICLIPIKNAKLRAWYNFLRANEIPNGALFSTGKNRGHLLQTRADYKISKNISAYFLAEYFIPGNFYQNTADDALFLRTELSFKFF